MAVHVYSAPLQPATRYFDDVMMGKENHFWTELADRHQLYCWNCRVKRWAKYLSVQVFYDSIRFWCKPGYGCKRLVRCPKCGRRGLARIKGRLRTEAMNLHRCKER